MWQKLLVSYLALGCLAGLVGYFGKHGISRIHRDFSMVTRDLLPAVEVLDELRFAGLQIVSSTVAYTIIAHHSEGAPVEKERETLQEDIARFHQAKSRYLALEKAHRHGAGAPTEPITRAGEVMLKASGDLVRKASIGRPANDLLVAKRGLLSANEEFQRLLNRAVEVEREQLSTRQQQVAETINASTQTMAAVGVGAFMLAVAIGIMMVVRFGWALQSLREGAELLSAGDLGTRLPEGGSGEVVRVTSAFNQMAERLQQAYSETESARLYLDNIINSMVEALYVTDLENTILMVNRAACTILKVSPEQVVGGNCKSFFAAPAHLEEIRTRMLERGSISEEETVLRTCDGEIIPVALSGAVMRIGDSAQGIVWLAHDIRERKRAEEEIRRLAYLDPLTELANRTLFLDRLAQAINMATRDNTQIALLLFDLDNFKEINEALGHGIGDRLLHAVGMRLQEGIRRSDTLARLGGDEFILMMPSAPDYRNISVVAQKLLGLLCLPFDLDGKEISISSSIGITLFPNDGRERDLLLSHADLALYAAKDRGRNAFCFYSEQMEQATQERRDLEARLRVALQNREFFLEYQPQFDLATQKLVSVEALVRWRDPERGLIPPDKFIRIAEDAGLIHQLGEWVLHEACRQAQEWADAGYPPFRVAVNLSGKQFLQANIIDVVDRVLQATGVDPHRLELELTESILMEKGQDTVSTLVDFKVRGINLAIDDFGTGYSSLSYLKFFPLDRLKIDRSFVRDIAEDPDDAAIVNAIIALSHSLGLKVIAEGVENIEQLSFLKKQGCDEAQGYYFAKSLAPEKIADMFTPP